MQLIVLGLNHKTAPVEVREKFNFSRSRIKHVLRLLKESDDFSEADRKMAWKRCTMR